MGLLSRNGQHGGREDSMMVPHPLRATKPSAAWLRLDGSKSDRSAGRPAWRGDTPAFPRSTPSFIWRTLGPSALITEIQLSACSSPLAPRIANSTPQRTRYRKRPSSQTLVDPCRAGLAGCGVGRGCLGEAGQGCHVGEMAVSGGRDTATWPAWHRHGARPRWAPGDGAARPAPVAEAGGRRCNPESQVCNGRPRHRRPGSGTTASRIRERNGGQRPLISIPCCSRPHSGAGRRAARRDRCSCLGALPRNPTLLRNQSPDLLAGHHKGQPPRTGPRSFVR